eukprot:4462960-Amphidinium_carterae.1
MNAELMTVVLHVLERTGQVYSFSVAAFDDAPAAKFSVYAPLGADDATTPGALGPTQFSLLELEFGPSVATLQVSHVNLHSVAILAQGGVVPLDLGGSSRWWPVVSHPSEAQ